jgi:hypothetical protein
LLNCTLAKDDEGIKNGAVYPETPRNLKNKMAPLYPHLINKRNSFCKEYLRTHLKFFSWFVANSAFLLLTGILHQCVAMETSIS